MRTLLIVALMAPIALAHSAQQIDRTDQEHTSWIGGVLRDIATIKPGMTRADLGRVFSEGGGCRRRVGEPMFMRIAPI